MLLARRLLLSTDMNKLDGFTAGVPVLSGALFAFEYSPLCRSAGMFLGAPSGALLGIARGVATAGAFAAATSSRPGFATLAGLVAGHAVLGALVGSFGAASDQQDRFVSPRFLAWLKRQQEDERASVEPDVMRPPLQLAGHQAKRRPARPDVDTDAPAARAA